MNTAPHPEARSDRRQLVEAVVASTIGTTIEWYDFFLYGTMAALAFADLFFPAQQDPFVRRLLALSTFTMGFLARPLGGVIFGHLGDRWGRKSSLVATLMLMGVSTFLIGLLPTYSQIGPAAPLLLTLLRFLQGVGVGGEWGGAVLLALEYGHRGKRGFYASWPQAGVPLGLLLSTGVVTLVHSSLDEADFKSWGWRVPFSLSALLCLVGWLIRKRITETPLFLELTREKRVAAAPVVEVIRQNWREILLAAGARLNENSCFYLFTVAVLAYAQDALQIPRQWPLRAVNVAAALSFFTMPLFGMLSDHLSRRRIYACGCLFLMAFAFPFYALLETRTWLGVGVAIVTALSLGHAALYSVQASLIPELFGTRLRYAGASLGYQLAAPLAGGVAPLIAATLVEWFPGHYWPLATYVILISAISLACVARLAETSRKDLSEPSELVQPLPTGVKVGD